jgi:hypothetical protein
VDLPGNLTPDMAGDWSVDLSCEGPRAYSCSRNPREQTQPPSSAAARIAGVSLPVITITLVSGDKHSL